MLIIATFLKRKRKVEKLTQPIHLSTTMAWAVLPLLLTVTWRLQKGLSLLLAPIICQGMAMTLVVVPSTEVPHAPRPAVS